MTDPIHISVKCCLGLVLVAKGKMLYYCNTYQNHGSHKRHSEHQSYSKWESSDLPSERYSLK